MTAIVFNGRNAIKWGTTNVARVYAGATLVWSVAVGLPYTNALASMPAGWTVQRGTWIQKTIGANAWLTASGAGAMSTSNTISAYNVRVTVVFSVNSPGASVGLVARDSLLGGHYQCDYTYTGALSISLTGTPLGSWIIPGAPKSGTMELSCIGTTITAKIGAVSHSGTDAAIHDPGTVGFEAASNGWVRDIHVTAA